jgi:hypothetical protein
LALKPEDLKSALDSVEQYGSINRAAAETGVARSTLQDRIKAAKRLGFDSRVTPDFEVQELPSEHEPVEDLIARRIAAFQRKDAAKKARDLIHVKVNVDGAYGILHFGDPHLDDDGCDWKAVEHCIKLLDDTEALFGANCGDSSNNWVGRLARLYGSQSVSASEAWRMVEWFMRRVPWLYIIGGNHDAWSGAQDPIRWMASNAGSLYEWHGVRLALTSPNGREMRVNARHDFQGTSQWNGAHAALKAAKMGWARDHLYTCAHRHSAAASTIFFNDGEHVAHALRIGTFKRYDDYAESKGFPRENMPAVVTVVNPSARTEAGLVTPFWDVDEGANYLRFLRSRR